MEQTEEERDEVWGWNVLEEEPDQRAENVDREKMAKRMSEVARFIAGVVTKVEATGAARENG